MNEVGIGLIGAGGMGLGVANAVVSENERLRIKGLFDPDDDALERVESSGHSGVKSYSTRQELVADPAIDWVMVASYNSHHSAAVVDAFNAGKNVFCQKPIATSLEDCLDMRDAWLKSGKLFSMGFNLRYSPHYRRIKELIDGGAVGRIVSMEFNETLEFNHGGYIFGDWRRLRANAGTHLLEKCCHDIDLVNWLVGSAAVRVASFAGLNFFIPANEDRIAEIGPNQDGLEAYRAWPGLVGENPFTSDKDIVDNQVAILEYASGVRAVFHTNCNAGIQERRMYIVGTHGAIRADLLTERIEVQAVGFDAERTEESTKGEGTHGGGDAVLAKELAGSMLNGDTPRVGLDAGLMAAITCFAVDEAMDTGRVVDVRPFWERVDMPIS